MDRLRVLNYLFGSEEIVDMRRELVLLREKLLNKRSPNFRLLCTGSLGEGVAFPSSDDDMMTYNDYYCAMNHLPYNTSRDIFIPINVINTGPFGFCHNYCCLHIDNAQRYKSSAGYCLLMDVAESLPDEIIHNINGISFFSSELFKNENKEPGQFIHGPCLSRVYGGSEIDETMCVVCPFWPNICNEWELRNRPYEWPSNEIIQSIVQSGYHLVPIGDPDSIYSDHEWRLSFSLAERRLMHSLNHAQFLTYNLLRYALKKVIDKQFPGVLCTYFMKTTLFHTIERTPGQMWDVDNLEICLIVCLAVLYNFIDYKNCPNFFIPEYNMIKRKVNDENKQKLLDLIRDLMSKGIFGLLDFYKSLFNIDKRTYSKKFEARHDLELFHGYHFRHIIAALRGFFAFPNDGTESYTSFITKVMHRFHELNKMMDTNHEYRNIILLEGISRCCQILINRFWSTTEQHKRKYNLHKAVIILLRLGQMGGLTTGKLTTASYMYLIGKTESALSVIEQVLSEYPPYDMNITDLVEKDCTLEPYCEQLCGRGYSLHYKARRTWALEFELFLRVQNVFPSPMKNWISIDEIVTLNPYDYGLVLESLCHIRLQDNPSLIKSIRRLVQEIDGFNNYKNATLKMCVGIILYTAGDNRSAHKCFGAAQMMRFKLRTPFKNTIPCSALTYIACLKFKERLKSGGNRKPRFQLPQRYPTILWICMIYFILLYSIIYYFFMNDMCFHIEMTTIGH